MARYRPIDVDMWSSPVILGYDCLQRDVFFFYHTRIEATTAGVYRINLAKDAEYFRLPDSPDHISADHLLSVIDSMPENLRYDQVHRLIWAVQFLQHNGLKHGRPALVRTGVRRTMSEFPQSKLWPNFIAKYPYFGQTLEEVSSDLSHKITSLSLPPEKTATYGTSSPSSKLSNFEQTSANFVQSFFNLNLNLNSSRKEEGGVGGEENQKAQTLAKKVASLLELREAQGRRQTTDTASALVEQLADFSQGNLNSALQIITYSLSNGYTRIFRPDGSPASKPPDTATTAAQKDPRTACMQAVAESGISSKGLTFALDSYRADITGGDKFSNEDIISHRSSAFIAWLKTFMNPARIAAEEELDRLGITDPLERTKIFAADPNFSPATIATLASEGITSPEAIKTKLLGEDTATKKHPMNNLEADSAFKHPLLAKAAKEGLSNQEYILVPFDLRQSLVFEKDRFRLKT